MYKMILMSSFFVVFLQECSKRANYGKFTLRDLLVVPMQRVLKYHLLLQVRYSCPYCALLFLFHRSRRVGTS